MPRCIRERRGSAARMLIVVATRLVAACMRATRRDARSATPPVESVYRTSVGVGSGPGTGDTRVGVHSDADAGRTMVGVASGIDVGTSTVN